MKNLLFILSVFCITARAQTPGKLIYADDFVKPLNPKTWITEIEPKPADVTMETIVSLCKRRGFVFPSAEIYGGFGSTYDYGPLGVELLRNVRNLWWKSMVQLRDDVVGL